MSEENADAMIEVLKDFGFGDLDVSREDFLNKGMVVQPGHPPN
jgi:hypothetical protein